MVDEWAVGRAAKLVVSWAHKMVVKKGCAKVVYSVELLAV